MQQNIMKSDSDSNPEIDIAELEALAKTVKPAKVRGKKGKKFADKSFMLSLVDKVNLGQEQKIQQSLERESEVLKRLAHRGGRNQKKETKKDKVTRMKNKLLKGNKKGQKDENNSKGKGDHRSFGNDKKQGKHSKEGQRTKGPIKSKSNLKVGKSGGGGGSSKKKVTFK
jgi:hypothetical protein